MIAKLFVRPSRRNRRQAARLGCEQLEGRDVPAAVAGTVFDDADGDHTLDAGEGGVAGIVFEFYDGGYTLQGSTTTASDGSYSIGGLSAGSGTVEFTIPSALRYSFAYPADESHFDAVMVTVPSSGTLTVNHSIYPDPTVSVEVIEHAVEGGAVGVFRFTRTGWTGHGLSFQYTVATGAGQATVHTDYGVLAGYGEFPEGESTVDVEVTAYLDAAADPDEEITVELTASSAVIVGGDPAVMAIVDTPQVVSVAQVADAVEGGADGTFEFTRTGYLGASLTVSYTVATTGDGVATSGTDYTALSGTVTFAAYSDTATATVDAGTDGTVEGVEWVSLMIDEDSDYEIGWADGAAVFIRDQTREVSVAGVQDAEEGGADGTLRFTRTGDLTETLTVTYTVATTGPSLATPTADYTALTGSVTFAANSATADVSVVTADDGVQEPDEVVIVTITAASTYTIGTGTGQVWIADDDGGSMYWISADDGHWWDPTNWSANREPVAGDHLYFTGDYNGKMTGFDTETAPLSYAGLHVLAGHTGTITLTVPVTFETVEMHAEDAVIDQPEGEDSALTITSRFDWTDGTINESESESSVTIDGAVSSIMPYNGGTIYTGSELNFEGGASGTIQVGTLSFTNDVSFSLIGAGTALALDTALGNVVLQVPANATRSAYVRAGTQLIAHGGAGVVQPSPLVVAGVAKVSGSTTLECTGGSGSVPSIQTEAGVGGYIVIEHDSTLAVSNWCVINPSGELQTHVKPNANLGLDQRTIPAQISGSLRWQGGLVTLSVGAVGPHVWGRLRVTEDMVWTGGNLQMLVSADATNGNLDKITVGRALSVTVATVAGAPIPGSPRFAAGTPNNVQPALNQVWRGVITAMNINLTGPMPSAGTIFTAVSAGNPVRSLELQS